MTYKIELAHIVRAFLSGLHEDDKQAVRVLLNSVAPAPELGDLEKVLDGVFYQKTYWLSRERWPDGLRLFYRYWNDRLLVAVIDVGDHRTCATHPGQSIYYLVILNMIDEGDVVSSAKGLKLMMPICRLASTDPARNSPGSTINTAFHGS